MFYLNMKERMDDNGVVNYTICQATRDSDGKKGISFHIPPSNKESDGVILFMDHKEVEYWIDRLNALHGRYGEGITFPSYEA